MCFMSSLLDPNERTFALAVIEAWTAQIGDDELPLVIPELRVDATP